MIQKPYGQNVDCPRCDGKIPNAETPGAYPGALSRLVSIEICSACGRDEAMRDFLRLAPVPPDQWPIELKIGEIL